MMNNSEGFLYFLKGIKHFYQKKKVLSISELGIIPGEIFGILGPSGAGKSTLLRLLNFLEKPTYGTIFYSGEKYGSDYPLPQLPVIREITTVFQSPILLNTTVYKNVIYPLKIRGMKVEKKKVMDLLTLVGLSEKAFCPAIKLSGGEAQRVALARALVFNPRVLLLDEPTANLDPANISIIERLITQTNKTNKTTIIIVTHNIFQAKRLCSRVLLLNEGKPVELNTAKNFFENPECNFTKSFIEGKIIY